MADHLEVAGHVFQLLADLLADLAQPPTAGAAAAGLTGHVVVCGGGGRAVYLLLARQVHRQAPVQRWSVGRLVSGRTLAVRAVALMRRRPFVSVGLGLIGRGFIQWYALRIVQERGLDRVFHTVLIHEAFAGGAELAVHAARELHLELGHHQAQQVHLLGLPGDDAQGLLHRLGRRR